MRSLLRTTLVAIVTLSCAAVAHAGWDWSTVANTTITGMGRTAKVPGATSAIQVLREAAVDLEGVWGTRPTLIAAVTDDKDTAAQAAASITAWGQHHRGVIFVVLPEGNGPRTASVTVLHDLDDAFAQSYPELLKAAGLQAGGGGGANGPALEWQTARFPDGSGQLRLPQGWIINNAVKGSVDAYGPQGSISLGASFLVATPQSYQASYPGVIVAEYSDPMSVQNAAGPVFAQKAQQTGAPWWEYSTVHDQQNLNWPDQRAAIIDRDVIVHSPDGTTKTYRGVFLLAMGQLLGGNFTLYQSLVITDRDNYTQNLPVLLTIWKSWGIAEKVFKERFDAAMAAMREANEANKKAFEDDSNRAQRRSDTVGYLITNRWVVTDAKTGKSYEIDASTMKDEIEKANKAEGYDRYKTLSGNELNQPLDKKP